MKLKWGITLIAGLICNNMAADTICSFNEPAALFKLHESEKRQQSVDITNYNSTYGNVATLNFMPGKHGYLELLLLKPHLLAERENTFKGTISLEICTQMPEAVKKISIRLVDSKGETFQLMQTLQLRRGEWTRISFPLDKTTKLGPIWGGNKDNKIDFPVRMSAITVDFDRHFPSSASIMIDNIVWTQP